jgi:hypothetical protein
MGRGATIGRWAAAIGALGVATLLAVTAIGHGDAGRPSAIQVAAGSGDQAGPANDGAFHEVEPTRVVPGDGSAVSSDGSATGTDGGTTRTGSVSGSGGGTGGGSTTTSSVSTLPGGVTVTTPDLTGTGPLDSLLDPLLGGATTTTVPGSTTTTTTTTPSLLGIPLPLPSTPLPPLLPGL